MSSRCSSQATIDITITVDCRIWIAGQGSQAGDPIPQNQSQTVNLEGKGEHSFTMSRRYYFGTGVDPSHADYGFYLFVTGLPEKITVHDVTFNPPHPVYTSGTTKALDEFDVVAEGKITVADDYAGEDASFQLDLELNTGETSVAAGRTLVKRSP